MTDEPALFPVDPPDTGSTIERRQRPRPVRKVKPWGKYVGHGRCHECIRVSAHDRSITRVAAWERVGRYGAELSCDAHRDEGGIA